MAYKVYTAHALNAGFTIPGAGDQTDGAGNNIGITGELAIVNVTTPGSADNEMIITDSSGGRELYHHKGPVMGCFIIKGAFSKGLYVVITGTTGPYYSISFGGGGR